MDKVYNIAPEFLYYFTKSNLTTKPMDNEDKSTVYDILKKTGF